MTPQEQKAYKDYLYNKTYEWDVLTTNRKNGERKGYRKGLKQGRAEGIKQGIEQGRAEERQAIAGRLKAIGVSEEEIRRVMAN